ncbi:Rad52/Rad22 family DNA repair protein [Aneurinibacillus thermoaerophilus]|uniref:Rad52/Rad22 family DNA repair protein n=1 Tax=Aneurinibacillus thermoaerophilus TaxID=143495 RepID=UPI002E2306D0|nr:Rad52/Rad22 family DNA repair protein [Aneurinibacillus thermoaerophilus]
MNKNYAELLNAPFKYEEYGVNYEGHVYIGQQSVADRLNEVFGIFGWEHKVIETKVDHELHTVSVFGRLSIFDESYDRWISREQFGDNVMNIRRNENEPTGQATENAKKAAVSDSLKKCASWFGLASDVYKGVVFAIKSGNFIFTKLATEFNLDVSEFGKYRHGIPILPDNYMDYYAARGWHGIFYSDFLRIQSKSVNPNAKDSQTTGETSGSGGNSNSPQEYRIKALSPTTTNADGTAIFEALMENLSRIKVLVPKELQIVASNIIAPENVYFVKGWLKPKKAILYLASRNSQIIPDINANASRGRNAG